MEMPLNVEIYIQPNTLSNVTFWNGTTRIYPDGDGGTISGEYIVYIIRTPSSNVTLKADGYEDLTIQVIEGDNNYATMEPVKNYISSITHKNTTYTIKDAKAREDIATKQDALATQTAYTSKGTATKVPQITTNTLGQVTGITEVDITHQSIKTLKTDNTTAQSTSSSEAVAGSGTINLHKVSKTGSYNDLLNKPTIPQGTVTSVRVQAGTGLSSSTSTAQSTTLNTTISVASGYKLPTTTEWSNKQDALPSQSGNSGKFLTTNGSTMSWETVDALPDQTGQSGKFLTTNGSTAAWDIVSIDIDDSTITKNSSDELQVAGVKDVRTDNTVKIWTGTKTQYNNIISNTWSTPVQGTNFSTTYGWDSVAYGNKKFVALSKTGYISTSTDGITWTSATQNSNLGSNGWCGLTYGNDKFVALSEDGELSTSIDGTTWTRYAYNQNLGDKRWYALAYGNNTYVALDEVGYVSYSTDGITWSTSVLNSNLNLQNGELGFWHSLAYDGTKFIALSTGVPRSVYTSTSVDGITWTSRETQSTLYYSYQWSGAFTYTGTELLAISHNGAISTSTDGTVWTSPVLDSNLNATGIGGWYSLTYGNNKLVTLSYNGYVSVREFINSNILYNVINDGLYLGTNKISSISSIWTYDANTKTLEIS